MLYICICQNKTGLGVSYQALHLLFVFYDVSHFIHLKISHQTIQEVMAQFMGALSCTCCYSESAISTSTVKWHLREKKRMCLWRCRSQLALPALWRHPLWAEKPCGHHQGCSGIMLSKGTAEPRSLLRR